jgi:hypothetical protein
MLQRIRTFFGTAYGFRIGRSVPTASKTSPGKTGHKPRTKDAFAPFGRTALLVLLYPTEWPIRLPVAHRWMKGRFTPPARSRAVLESRALNSAVECHLHTVEVIGSNPIAPTKNLSGSFPPVRISPAGSDARKTAQVRIL